MRSLLFVITLVFTSFSQADSITDGWKWAVSFDNSPNFKASSSFEILSPKLFGTENEYSLVLSASTKRMNYNIINDDLSLIPVRLMLEARNPVYKDIVSSYVRIGAGYSFASNVLIHKDDGYFIIPVVIGVDLISSERNGIHASVFTQASFDASFVKPSEGLANDFDGATVSIGVRVFY